MIREVLADEAGAADARPVTALERAARWGHAGVVLRLKAPATVTYALERALLEAGAFAVRPTDDDDPTTPGVLAAAGALVLVAEERGDAISLRIGNSREELLPSSDAAKAVASLLRRLREANVFDRERAR